MRKTECLQHALPRFRDYLCTGLDPSDTAAAPGAAAAAVTATGATGAAAAAATAAVAVAISSASAVAVSSAAAPPDRGQCDRRRAGRALDLFRVQVPFWGRACGAILHRYSKLHP